MILLLVRDLNFLNVLDLIFDKSKDFVITERPRGCSIADLLRERSPLNGEDVLGLVTPLAGALDLAATFRGWNPISICWLFMETRYSFAVDLERQSLSEWSRFLIKLDVWELVRPRKNTVWAVPRCESSDGRIKRIGNQASGVAHLPIARR